MKRSAGSFGEAPVYVKLLLAAEVCMNVNDGDMNSDSVHITANETRTPADDARKRVRVVRKRADESGKQVHAVRSVVHDFRKTGYFVEQAENQQFESETIVDRAS